MARRRNSLKSSQADAYLHREAQLAMRPEVGTQAQFRKRKPPVTYRYDSSLAPELNWDGQNPAREVGEWLLAIIEEAAKLPPPHVFPEPRVYIGAEGKVLCRVTGLQDAVDQLKRLSRPFLNWAGKAERLSFDVPTLPLFVHERLSTKAIIETLKGHRRTRQASLFELFADPQHPITDQVLRAYEHQDQWVNRLILGDSLVVMNSLLQYENLGGQVQMIYMDPPYGVRFGSNFQPFVRDRGVDHNKDEHLTREPEMVKAYRDTWELGLHSYLTYLRDRLLLARELLSQRGSIFVQIGNENLHHVRQVLDEVFGPSNFVAMIPFRKKTMPLGARTLEEMNDYLLWYAKDRDQMLFHQLYREQDIEGDAHWNRYELPDGSRHGMTPEQLADHRLLPPGARVFRLVSMWPPSYDRNAVFPVVFRGKTYMPPPGQCWPTGPEGIQRLIEAHRVEVEGNFLRYVLYHDDYPLAKVTNLWTDTTGARNQRYVVETSPKVIERCILMTTNPGDLVLDPTCGGGTTAYVAERWGRRWIAIDVSRVPIALTRERLLTATFPWYELKDESRGPAGGFVYRRRQNSKGEEVGGIVPHITLKSIANNEPPEEEVLVDRPEVVSGITRVTGPFVVESTIPPPVDGDPGSAPEDGQVPVDSGADFSDRLLEALRRSPVLHLGNNRTVTLKQVRPPAKSLSLSAEALTSDGDLPVAFVFGPENGAVSESLVFEAAREARAKGYTHLYVIGFAIQPNARLLVERCEKVMGIPATYVQATPDLLMGDLLKNMRSSQIFSVCGLPEVELRRLADGTYQVELLGLDVFDPVTMEVHHKPGDDVPAWFLDTDYNNLVFHICQAFFPRTGAWDNLRRALQGQYDDRVWEHLAGTVSTPFEAGEHGQIAVKVIDDRGNELLVVKRLSEARPG